tara:strand:+ start:442 stop:1200 length:759 start_codon:yes stop_codon:yes gene_type:complete
MNYKSVIVILLLLTSCINNTDIIRQNKDVLKNMTKFSNSGFTLIYDEKLFLNKIINKKMSDRDLVIFQKNLKKGTPVKIANPTNNKSLIAQVGKNSVYPSFNNSVISKRIASELELSVDEPFIIIEEIVHNSSFIAKKAKTFDEEKKVADKAPVDKITVNNLNETNENKNNIKINKFNYSIKIADFYFLDTAQMMKNKILNETNIVKIKIQKLSKNKFRVILGPYLDLKSLKNEYNKLTNFNFENIEIIRNV